MAGATNKSAKRLGFSQRQIGEQRAKGGVLSHAALLAAGAPARPTKAYKALVADMAERKKGLARKAEPPAGWKAAARGEGKAERDAAHAARAAVLAERGQAKRAAMAQRGAADLGRGMMAKATEANRPDPHAEKRARIAQLEHKVELGKKINKVIRAEEKKGGEGWEERAAQRLLSEKILTNEGIARKVVRPDFAGRRGVPGYEFTNTGATIRRLKDEIGAERKKGVAWDQRKIRHVPDFGPGGVRI